MRYRLIAIIGLMLISVNVHAVSITWTLVDWVFEDDGVATGSFNYDADTGQFSNVNVQTTSSSGNTLYTQALDIQGDVGLDLVPALSMDLTGSPILSVVFDIPFTLSNSGGVGEVLIGLSSELICDAADCAFLDFSAERLLVSGSVSAVPVPAAAWLFLSALIGLTGFGRRRHRANKTTS